MLSDDRLPSRLRLVYLQLSLSRAYLEAQFELGQLLDDSGYSTSDIGSMAAPKKP